jgi:alkanesulfonate monooxygenase SsuD/methylene tetrahydromethanopterin reductase-like flavin-dependent oxidoreductase (luciferase family)
VTEDLPDRLLAGGAGTHVDSMLTYTALGTPSEVRDYLERFVELSGADELIVAHQAANLEARLRSVTLAAEAMQLVGA